MVGWKAFHSRREREGSLIKACSYLTDAYGHGHYQMEKKIKIFYYLEKREIKANKLTDKLY